MTLGNNDNALFNNRRAQNKVNDGFNGVYGILTMLAVAPMAGMGYLGSRRHQTGYQRNFGEVFLEAGVTVLTVAAMLITVPAALSLAVVTAALHLFSSAFAYVADSIFSPASAESKPLSP